MKKIAFFLGCVLAGSYSASLPATGLQVSGYDAQDSVTLKLSANKTGFTVEKTTQVASNTPLTVNIQDNSPAIKDANGQMLKGDGVVIVNALDTCFPALEKFAQTHNLQNTAFAQWTDDQREAYLGLCEKLFPQDFHQQNLRARDEQMIAEDDRAQTSKDSINAFLSEHSALTDKQYDFARGCLAEMRRENNLQRLLRVSIKLSSPLLGKFTICPTKGISLQKSC